MNLTDITPTGNLIAEINGERFILRRWESGYWRAIKVKQDSNGFWFCCDDDDWIISDGRVLWREVGWEMRKEQNEQSRAKIFERQRGLEADQGACEKAKRGMVATQTDGASTELRSRNG